MKRLGRPKNDDAYLIRAKAWFNAVSLKSGMGAAELEVLFCKTSDKYSPGKRPGLWSKYRDGEVCPKFKPDRNGCPSIVERVEKRFPGTAQWMTMPFWDALSSAPMEMSDLKNLYLSLPQHVRLLIVAEPSDKRKTFWRRPIDPKTLFSQLSKINDLDAATAILALIKEAETTQDQQMHRQAVACWENHLEKMQHHPVLSSIIEDIHELVMGRLANIEHCRNDGTYFQLHKEANLKLKG